MLFVFGLSMVNDSKGFSLSKRYESGIPSHGDANVFQRKECLTYVYGKH